MVRKQEIERNRRYRKIHKEACDLEIVTVTITKLPYGPQGTGKVLSYEILCKIVKGNRCNMFMKVKRNDKLIRKVIN